MVIYPKQATTGSESTSELRGIVRYFNEDKLGRLTPTESHDKSVGAWRERRVACYRNEVLDCVSRGIPKLNYTSSLSENKHPYPQESKLNASEKITHAHTRAHVSFALVFVGHPPRASRSRACLPCPFFLLFFFFCRRRGWTFRATKKDALSAAGNPRNTLEFRPPVRSIESACFSSSGKTILPSYYC